MKAATNGMPASVIDWTTSHVKEWLIQHEFTTYAHLLCDIHRIDGTALLMLTEDDLKSPPLNIEILGDVKKLALSLYHLRTQHKEEILRLGLSQYSSTDSLFKNYVQKTENKRTAGGYSRQSSIKQLPQIPIRERSLSPESSVSTFLFDDLNSLSPADGNPRSFGMAKHLEPEIWKTLLSITYFVSVTCITAMVMVIVHDRVPDMKKYPPLPDIFLDNVPLIPWAFDMCEVCGCLLTMTWILVLIFHKHRFILMRRFFALTGSVFLLRCVTMLITSLSVPGAHLACAPRPYGDIWAKLEKALDIWRGFGMSVRGVRTCGDYMFSGHTVVLTMLNFFITEYTPRRLYFLHTFTWILNLFGIFFILAAREHYSIDVFVAFYITSRLFLYYHTLANSRALRQRDQARAKIWFPLFSFFEARIDGMIPNEYQMPWANLSLSPLIKYIRSLLRQSQPNTLAAKSSPNNDKRSSSHRKPKKKAT